MKTRLALSFLKEATSMLEQCINKQLTNELHNRVASCSWKTIRLQNYELVSQILAMPGQPEVLARKSDNTIKFASSQTFFRIETLSHLLTYQ